MSAEAHKLCPALLLLTTATHRKIFYSVVPMPFYQDSTALLDPNDQYAQDRIPGQYLTALYW